MRKNKLCYEAPSAEVLVVRFEEALLTVSGEMSAKGWTAGNSSWWDDEE